MSYEQLNLDQCSMLIARLAHMLELHYQRIEQLETRADIPIQRAALHEAIRRIDILEQEVSTLTKLLLNGRHGKPSNYHAGLDEALNTGNGRYIP